MPTTLRNRTEARLASSGAALDQSAAAAAALPAGAAVVYASGVPRAAAPAAWRAKLRAVKLAEAFEQLEVPAEPTNGGVGGGEMEYQARAEHPTARGV